MKRYSQLDPLTFLFTALESSPGWTTWEISLRKGQRQRSRPRSPLLRLRQSSRQRPSSTSSYRCQSTICIGRGWAQDKGSWWHYTTCCLIPFMLIGRKKHSGVLVWEHYPITPNLRRLSVVAEVWCIHILKNTIHTWTNQYFGVCWFLLWRICRAHPSLRAIYSLCSLNR